MNRKQLIILLVGVLCLFVVVTSAESALAARPTAVPQSLSASVLPTPDNIKDAVIIRGRNLIGLSTFVVNLDTTADYVAVFLTAMRIEALFNTLPLSSFDIALSSGRLAHFSN
ncbi:MAG: hypothetical protein LLG44_10340 [Chloroflexi bacterium]|nr:hypothetical protein [Chloroflexota bacterium]